MSILAASTSLMIRTFALWERKLVVVVPLGILCLGHWGLLFRGMSVVDAVWSNDACVVTKSDPFLLKITFFFTMIFDFVTLATTTVALMRTPARSGLWHLLFRDGLVYFLVSFSTNSIPAILNALNLNTVMNIIATVPAALISSVAACRAVIRLQEYKSPEVYVHSTDNATQGGATGLFAVHSKHTGTRPEVRVTTDYITMAEFSPSSVSAYEKRTSDTVSFDLEAVAPFEAKFNRSADCPSAV